MNIVDDATNIAQLHFEREETIVSACRCAWSWFQQYGVPRAFYADGHLDYASFWLIPIKPKDASNDTTAFIKDALSL